MNTKHIFFFDIDGTMLEHRTWSIHPSTLDAICLLKAAGNPVYINTGRSINEMRNVNALLEPCQLDGILYSGGAHIICGDYEAAEYLPLAQAVRLMRHLVSRGITCRWQALHTLAFEKAPDEATKHVLTGLFGECPPTKTWSGEELVRLVTYADDLLLEELRRMEPELQLESQGGDVINVTARGVSKASGMLREAARRGFSKEQTVAFGDSTIDVPMLKAAGVGIAMGDGTEDARVAADYVSTGVAQEGIWDACRKYGWI